MLATHPVFIVNTGDDGGFDDVDNDVDHQAKEEESRRGNIGSHLDEERSKEVQGMVNRLNFLMVVVMMKEMVMVLMKT